MGHDEVSRDAANETGCEVGGVEEDELAIQPSAFPVSTSIFAFGLPLA